VYPVQVSTNATSGIEGDTRNGASGGINFGSFAVGSGARATTDAGMNWQTLALAAGAAVVGFLLLRRFAR
jgi:hypothetical protein